MEEFPLSRCGILIAVLLVLLSADATNASDEPAEPSAAPHQTTRPTSRPVHAGVSEPLSALQRSAPPQVNFNAPNLLLPARVTHIAELEFVKAWHAVASPPTIPAAALPPSANASRVVARWDIIGTVLVALYGDHEPELVRRFVAATRRAYGIARGMGASLRGVAAVDGAGGAGGKISLPLTFVTRDAIRHGRSRDDAPERPPWAQANASRWVVSAVVAPHVVGVTIVVPENATDATAPTVARLPSEKPSSRQSSNAQERPPRVALRAGAVLHRARCRDRHASPSASDFSWYALASREAGQLLQADELSVLARLHEEQRVRRASGAAADVLLPHDDENGNRDSDRATTGDEKLTPNDRAAASAAFLAAGDELADMCAGDRVFGHVVSGFDHLERIASLPVHHFHESNADPESGAAQPPIAAPMQHVSVSRATVYDWPGTAAGFAAMRAAASKPHADGEETRDVDGRLRWWQEWSLGSAMAATDLDGDVRRTRASFVAGAVNDERRNDNASPCLPVPNATRAAELWAWCDANFHAITQKALRARISKDERSRQEFDELRAFRREELRGATRSPRSTPSDQLLRLLQRLQHERHAAQHGSTEAARFHTRPLRREFEIMTNAAAPPPPAPDDDNMAQE
jgi:hypothetical protein